MLTRYILAAKIRIKQSLFALPAFRKTPLPFIILCTGRSGSTLLHTFLNSHWNILSHGEYLGRKLRKDQRIKLDYIFCTRHVPLIHTTGMKIFYEYYQTPALQEPLEFIESLPGLRVIHLIRENIPEQFLSRKLAMESGEWTGPRRSGKFRADPEECLAYCRDMEKSRHEAGMRFGNHQVLMVSYEELTNRTSETLQQIQEFLDVPATSLKSVLTRQNPGSLAERLENFEEFKAVFQETPWEHFVTES